MKISGEMGYYTRKRTFGWNKILFGIWLGSWSGIMLITILTMVWLAFGNVEKGTPFTLQAVIEVSGVRADKENLFMFLAIFCCYSLPFLLLYLPMRVSQRRFLEYYNKMPQREQRELERALENMVKEAKKSEEPVRRILVTEHYIYYDKQAVSKLIPRKEVVWMYEAGLWLNPGDMVQFFSMMTGMGSRPDGYPGGWIPGPGERPLLLHTLRIYTGDGKRQKIFMGNSQELAPYCPGAMVGYGKEQKTRAKEIFRDYKMKKSMYR